MNNPILFLLIFGFSLVDGGLVPFCPWGAVGREAPANDGED